MDLRHALIFFNEATLLTEDSFSIVMCAIKNQLMMMGRALKDDHHHLYANKLKRNAMTVSTLVLECSWSSIKYVAR